MRELRRKLHSKAGASMLLALLFLLFCGTVGAVVLTAASANTGRLNRNMEEQKSYLAVESAALLLRDDFSDLKLEGQYDHDVIETEIMLEDGSTEIVTQEAYREGATRLTQSPLATLGGMQGDLERLFLASFGRFPSRTAPAQMVYPITLAAERELQKVMGVITVNTTGKDRYAITVVLKTAAGDNPMTLHFATKTPVESRSAPRVSTSGKVTTTTVTHTWTYGWVQPKITKGEVTPP